LQHLFCFILDVHTALQTIC